MIAAQQLTKRFGTVVATDNVTFSIDAGQVVGFIGSNGAGKTTTMRMLSGFLPASSGRAVVAGFDVFDDPMSVRHRVGYLPETPPLYPELTIGEYLNFVAQVRAVPSGQRMRRIGSVMEMVGLVGWERRILGELSKGYRQRVGLAQAVIHDPEVLLLDEPTSGLDPRQVVGIRKFIRNLAETRTVVLSTHILSEVESLCSRVVMIDGGKIVADDTMDGVRNGAGDGLRYRVELSGSDPTAVPVEVGELGQVTRVVPHPEVEEYVVLDVYSSTDPRPAIAELAQNQGWKLRTMMMVQPTLEEAFLAIAGGKR